MRVVRWGAEAGDDLGHLVLSIGPDGISGHGVVIGNRAGAAYALCYRVYCVPGWSVRSFVAELAGGGSVSLDADGRGSWEDTAGKTRPDLAGCIDLDLAATPFTNTLPIRRLGLAPGERRVIRVAYVYVRSLQREPSEQAYTYLSPQGRYRYEGLRTGFTTELETDGDGVVVDYPGVWRRLIG